MKGDPMDTLIIILIIAIWVFAKAKSQGEADRKRQGNTAAENGEARQVNGPLGTKTTASAPAYRKLTAPNTNSVSRQSSSPARSTVSQTASSASPKRTMTAEERKKLADYRSRTNSGAGKASGLGSSGQPAAKQKAGTPAVSTTQALAQKKLQMDGSNIMDRAKANNTRFQEDETLKEIEEFHGHSEEHQAEPVEHSRNCQALEKEIDAIVNGEGIFGSTEDLIVKGYDGNMQFGRDFIGEASDMLTAISYANTMPELKSDLLTELNGI